MLPLGDTAQLQRKTQTQSEEVKKETTSKWHQRKEGITILISDKIDFKIKKVMREKWAFYNDKGDNVTRRHTLINIHAPNLGAEKSIKQLLTEVKGETEKTELQQGT